MQVKWRDEADLRRNNVMVREIERLSMEWSNNDWQVSREFLHGITCSQ